MKINKPNNGNPHKLLAKTMVKTMVKIKHLLIAIGIATIVSVGVVAIASGVAATIYLSFVLFVAAQKIKNIKTNIKTKINTRKTIQKPN